MIRAFVLTILLAAIFTGLSYPVYWWLLRWARGHEALAAIARSFCCCCWSSHRCSQYLEPGQTERYESPRPSGRASNNSWTSRARAIQPVGSVAIDPVEQPVVYGGVYGASPGANARHGPRIVISTMAGRKSSIHGSRATLDTGTPGGASLARERSRRMSRSDA
jgi:hypothetical protein